MTDLFGFLEGLPPDEPPKQPTGWELAEAGAAQAGAHADAKCDGWQDRAYSLLSLYAKTVAPEFLTEDVRHFAHKQHGLPMPPDGRAWGAVVLRALKAGLLQKIGYQPMKSRNCHSDPKPLWRWMGA